MEPLSAGSRGQVIGLFYGEIDAAAAVAPGGGVNETVDFLHAGLGQNLLGPPAGG